MEHMLVVDGVLLITMLVVGPLLLGCPILLLYSNISWPHYVYTTQHMGAAYCRRFIVVGVSVCRLPPRAVLKWLNQSIYHLGVWTLLVIL